MILEENEEEPWSPFDEGFFIKLNLVTLTRYSSLEAECWVESSSPQESWE